jgi:hypothetical protein
MDGKQEPYAAKFKLDQALIHLSTMPPPNQMTPMTTTRPTMQPGEL